ncbi:hypothetical protein CCICO_01020 [Corynebacterium ciconiae DSM 44920]|uniref:DUF2613 domain-containing protein n=1 Tax=Corynebacterium ciconiae TaxID=227319 RepID=UPI000380234D|nr:DUF2613 domain-containing protein [Corynebacterium ciconiae]WKD60262.1 hypothetical protein CCICO_01020 [Corynebacterium ciconiae DSM 44920]
MALESDSVTRRTIGPAFASAVVGLLLGMVAILGLSIFSSQDSVPQSHAVNSDDALLGGVEYGTR